MNGNQHIILPLPPIKCAGATDHEIYMRFMKHYRLVPASRVETKILSALQFTADLLDIQDALITRILADMGLRAPRDALPESYLEYVDRSIVREAWEPGAPTASSLAMKAHWDAIGDDRFVPLRSEGLAVSKQDVIPA